MMLVVTVLLVFLMIFVIVMFLTVVLIDVGNAVPRYCTVDKSFIVDDLRPAAQLSSFLKVLPIPSHNISGQSI